MTDIAAQARAAAVQLEVKKDGLQQRQSGDWTLRFVAQGIDMPDSLMKAPMGTRFVCVLVEVGDDETPVQPKGGDAHAQATKSAQLDTTRPVEAPPRSGGRRFEEVPPAQQAGIICGEQAFCRYLEEKHGYKPNSPKDAAEAVREICGVTTRAWLDQEPAFSRWHHLLGDYRTWQRAPEFVG